MKIRATESNPGRIHIKRAGDGNVPSVNLWIEPVGLDGKPGKWVEIHDSNKAALALVERHRQAGSIEVEGFIKRKSSAITQCAADPRCTQPIVSKELNMCHHHMMKLHRAVDKAKTPEQLAVAEDILEKAVNAAEKQNESSKVSAKAANAKIEKAEKEPKVKKPARKRARKPRAKQRSTDS